MRSGWGSQRSPVCSVCRRGARVPQRWDCPPLSLGPRPGFSCPSRVLVFAECSGAKEPHVSPRKIHGKGKGGGAGEAVFVGAGSRTEPLVFLRGRCRSLKCAIAEEFLKEHLFSDESPYLGLYSYI